MTPLVVGATLATVMVAAPAHAQPATPVVPTSEVSEGVALGLALGGSAASYGALIAGGYSGNYGALFVGSVGALLAPSLGKWYAHDGFTRGMGIRIAGLGVAALGVLVALDNGLVGDNRTVDVLLLISAGVVVAGTIDDIVTTPSAARKYNARSNSPMLVPTANAHGGGVSLVGRF